GPDRVDDVLRQDIVDSALVRLSPGTERNPRCHHARAADFDRVHRFLAAIRSGKNWASSDESSLGLRSRLLADCQNRIGQGRSGIRLCPGARGELARLVQSGAQTGRLGGAIGYFPREWDARILLLLCDAVRYIGSARREGAAALVAPAGSIHSLAIFPGCRN